MKLKVGQALVSVVDDTKVPDGDVVLTCGGAPLVPKGSEVTPADADPAHLQGSLLGKRYVDADGTVEVLCTKAGPASLALDGVLLATAEAKALPSSD